ncbi:FAD-binding oxidoreductase [Noviherbaspirillum sp. L7-7A]|uniref:FAD-binding oxidoreductase n=1 Tax=Noviherbaspirillum sp. L7-7A TaxID=2850560 RepID=UPI001C2BC83E|nr:FAD-binding oxidoreductase [Noviherbaspirillum sp. L7-7A]MBV0881459.1 FAD-binding oxidoreductase [Noviherbaspirillum sp. L7-7A]
MDSQLSIVTSHLYAALISELGAENVSSDADIAQRHAGDWSETAKEPPSLVIFPRSPAQVAAALAVLSRFGPKAVIQGGLTGLAGAATPHRGEVALSLSKLNQIEEFDRVGGTVTVQAGVTLEQMQTCVEAEGWFFPLDLGARGTCQIGGNAATNAGGNRVIRYGTMRDLVLGLEVALPDGSVMTMLNRVTKNTTGIDLKHLFIGAEGILGVITRLVLKLAPKPSSTVTALCALTSFDDAAALLKDMQLHLPTLSAFELMWQGFIDKAVEITGARQPFTERHPVYVLVELLGASDEQDRAQLEAFLAQALEQELVQDVIVAQSIEHAKQLWEYRESIGEMLARLKPHAAFDVGIPVAAMDGFVRSVQLILQQQFPQQSHLFFGHLGDGNLHLLSGPYPAPATLHQVEEIVYQAVGKVKGSISAEHGIGVIKKEFLHFSRSPEELALMRALKRLLDPNNVLNAGRIFD